MKAEIQEDSTKKDPPKMLQALIRNATEQLQVTLKTLDSASTQIRSLRSAVRCTNFATKHTIYD